ncbi:MAG TPA: LysE family translocator [Burkholderiaceae bacterium]|nr:LysE family translocator [Burkholderiaceae bacterium]
MFDPHSLALFALASVALIATPGPDMVLMIVRSLGGGPRDGVLVTAGLVGGIVFHTCIVAFGLAALLAASAVAFTVVKWIGAGYLVYLGLRALRQPVAPFEAEKDARCYRAAELLMQGFLSNALNPKVALFFFTFLPQFADGRRAPLVLQLLLLGSLFAVMGFTSYAVLSFAVGRARTLLATGARRVLTRTSGVIMVALGARLALTER